MHRHLPSGPRRRVVAVVVAAVALTVPVGCSGSDAPGADASPTDTPSPTAEKVQVPLLVGLTEDEVAERIADIDLEASVTLDAAACPDYDPDGEVTIPVKVDDQDPASGSRAEPGSTIQLHATVDCAAFEAAKAEAARVAEEARVAAEAEAARKAEEERIAAASVSQQNARRKALDYMDVMAFSRAGLINQLEFEGFSTEDATWGVDNITVDWMAQAAKKAQDYLDIMGFSRSGLIEQLMFEGFSREEAEHGATSVGL